MNLKTKTNTVKQILAKVMIVILLLASVLNLSGCWFKPYVKITEKFESHNDFLKFIQKYSSKNDGFVHTFVSFDFDNNETVMPYMYELRTVWKKNVDMYDKDHVHNFYFQYVFYANNTNDAVKNEYQIRCYLSTDSKDYNFYQDDKMSVKLIEKYNIEDSYMKYDDMSTYFGGPESYHKSYADLRFYNYETSDYDEYYNYMYMYMISINEKEEVRVEITSKIEFTQEKLDAICQLLMDNIVIINTEG